MSAKKILLTILFATTVGLTYGANCSLNAGVDQSICLGTATLTGDYSGIFPGTGRVTAWSQVAGPSATITSPNSLVSTVVGMTGRTSGNTYRFRITSTCEDGSSIYDEVSIFVSPFPTASAGNDTTICSGTSVGKLRGSLLAGQTGVWSISSGSTGLTIVNPTSPNGTLTLTSGAANTGVAVLRWTVTTTATGCTAYDEVNFTKNSVVTTISAGSNATISGCYNSTTQYTLAGSYAGGGTNGVWSVVSGPNVPSFAAVNTYNTTVSNLIPGVYVLRWTVNGTCVSGTATVQLTVNAPLGSVSTASAVISGGTNSALYCVKPTELILNGSTYNSDTETVLWTKVSGTATIASPTSRNTSVTGFDGITTTVIRYTITSKAYPATCSSTSNSSTVTISFEAGQTLAITNAKPFVLACGALPQAIINITQSGNTAAQWSLISGPTIGAPTAYSTNLTTSSTSFTVPNLTLAGTYLVRVRKVIGSCTTLYDEVNVVVSKSPTAANGGSDLTLACNVTTGELIGNTPTVGTGRWTQLSGPTSATISAPTTPRCPISGLTNGLYQFRWTINSGPTCPTNQDEVWVKIASINPTTADAGVDQTICNSTPLYLLGNATLLNETGTWSVSPSAGVVFSNVNSSRPIVTGLAPSTTYTFTWRIINSCGTSTDNVVVTTNATLGPIAALAGADQCLSSGTTSITMAGNDAGSGAGLWTKLTGGSASISNPSQFNTTVTGMSNGTYTFVWSITRNACTITTDTVSITISAPATTANAGADQQNLCGSTAILNANTAVIGTGRWSQITGSGGAVINNPVSPSTTVSGLIDGLYTFRWTITNNACSSSFDDVLIYASMPPTAPNAGIDKTICGATLATMTANSITVGTGYWSLISGPNSPTITNNALPTTTITGLVTGEPYVLSWNSRNGLCTVLSDTVVVTVIPTATAGSAQTLCGATTAALTGNANTNGVWSIKSPAVTTEIITPTALGWSSIASGLVPGKTYTFTYTLSYPGCVSSKDVVVTVLDNPTYASAGNNLDVCILGSLTNDTTITMAANLPTIGVGSWLRTSGPVVGTITSPNSPTTTISGLIPGIYTYSWTITNGTCTSVDQLMVRVSKVVQKSAGNDLAVCGATANMSAGAPASGVGTWSKVAGPASNPTFAFNSSVSPTTSVTGLIPGEYTLRWTVTDGVCNGGAYDDMLLTISTAPTTPNAGVDQNVCNQTTFTLAANTISIGTGTWTLISGPNTPTITNINSPTTTISGTQSGTYVFRWTASNGACAPLIDEVSILNYAAPSNSVAGVDIRACLYSPIQLAANTPTVGTGLWTQIEGSPITFTDASSPTTTITGALAGSYKFRWTISNGNCSTNLSDVNLIIDQPSTIADAGPDQSPQGTSVNMAGNIITGGSGTWSKISGAQGAVVVNANSPTTSITGLVSGTYVYRWTSTNGTCSSYDEMEIIKGTQSCIISNKMISPILK